MNAFGAYASYVWSAYALLGSVLMLNVIVVRSKRKKIIQEIKDASDS